MVALVPCPEGYGVKGDQCVHVPAGPFKRGSSDKSPVRAVDVGPVRDIDVSAFFMDPAKMTRREFRSLMTPPIRVYLQKATTCGENPVRYETLALDPNKLPTDLQVGKKIEGREICKVEVVNVTDEVVKIMDMNIYPHAFAPLPKDTKNDDLPASTVSWYGAQAACLLKGGRLLTEAEWEKAFRGIEYRAKDMFDGYEADEWVADSYQADYYETASKDPSGPREAGLGKVLCHGLPDDANPNDLQWICVGHGDPGLVEGDVDVGFRCGRSEGSPK